MADPYFSDSFMAIYGGDCRAVMAEMPAESVHCVVTSPPYWGLRDYGTDGQLGLEATPEAYVANMVDVFREVRRVLRDDGTLWLNLGDSYAAQRGGTAMPAETLAGGVGGKGDAKSHRGRNTLGGRQDLANPDFRTGPVAHRNAAAFGLKHKDLVGIPWRVAFALQADGWYLRSDIIWSKPNPMPESVTDRPTKAHEYLFLLTKSPRYYYDAEAIKEPASGASEHDLTGGGKRWPGIGPKHGMTDRHKSDYEPMTVNPSRNIRSVWTIATEPYSGAHFATFPRKLVEPCVKAGTSERGVCPECGAPWERVVGRDCEACGALVPTQAKSCPDCGHVRDWKAGRTISPELVATDWSTPGRGTPRLPGGFTDNSRSDGWRPTCSHKDGLAASDEAQTPSTHGDRASEGYHEPVPAVVLDPFAGSGTTLLVAQALGRKGVGIDLNPEYLEMAVRRVSREFGRGKVTEIKAKVPDEGLWGL